MPQTSSDQDFHFDLIRVLTVIGIAILTSSFSEFISWALLYRKQDYKINKNEIDRLNKKYQKLKNTHVTQSHKKVHEKKLTSVQSTLKNINQQMTFQSLKSNLVIGLLMIGVINMVGTYFQGIVVAKFPFEPFSLIRGITHRNIQGEDYSQSAYLPFYIMTAMIWRSNIKKLFGFEPPKAAVSMFDPPKYKPQ